MTRAYLDHAATTPMVGEAVEAMSRELTRTGNPSSLHGSGRAARRVVEEAREVIAAAVGAQPSEVIFTSGGTEADNLAVKGVLWAGVRRGRRGVVISAVEHHAVLDPVEWLGESGAADVTLAEVDRAGRVDLDGLAAAVTAETALVSVMWANNEVGTVQPVAKIALIAAERGALSHSDAVQAVGHLPVDFAASGLDLLTLTAHKLGGPYGVGALLVGREVVLTPVQHGGGQEREVRSGTLDVPAIAGFAAAVKVTVRDREREFARLRALRATLMDGVRAAVPDAVVHGTLDSEESLPGLVNIGFPGGPADAILMLLDAAGVDCSAGSACAAGVAQPSHVLQAMGYDAAEARSSLRFSLGRTSIPADVAALLAALPEAVSRARAASRFA